MAVILVTVHVAMPQLISIFSLEKSSGLSDSPKIKAVDHSVQQRCKVMNQKQIRLRRIFSILLCETLYCLDSQLIGLENLLGKQLSAC